MKKRTRKRTPKKKDELTVLVNAWLKKPKVAKLFNQGKIDQALKAAGVHSKALSSALKRIDVADIKRITRATKRPPGKVTVMG